MTLRVALDDAECDELSTLLRRYADELERRGDRDSMGRCRRLARSVDDRLERVRAYRAVNAPPPAPWVAPAGPPPSEPPASPAESRPGVLWPRTQTGITRLMVQAGIGDILWAWQVAHGLQRRWGTPVEMVAACDLPSRAEECVRLLPGVRWGGYGDFSSQDVVDGWESGDPRGAIDDLRGRTVPFSLNRHLELGRRLETRFPEVETAFRLKVGTTDEHRDRAAEIVARAKRGPGRPPKGGKTADPVIGVYTSTHGPTRAWDGWDDRAWIRLLKAVYERQRCSFVLMGAVFDREMVDPLKAALDRAKIPCRSCLGEPFGVAAEVLRSVDLFLGFPSGLTVTAVLLGTPSIWWLPDIDLPGGGNLAQLTGWTPPGNPGLLLTRPQETPEDAARWLLDSGGIARAVREP